MLYGLVPKDVVRKHKDEIYEVMGELAGIVVEEDGSPWTYSRKECVDWACDHFSTSALVDKKLRPKLTNLVRTVTWNPEWEY